MNIHLPAILMFTRGTRFWHTAIYPSPQVDKASRMIEDIVSRSEEEPSPGAWKAKGLATSRLWGHGAYIIYTHTYIYIYYIYIIYIYTWPVSWIYLIYLEVMYVMWDKSWDFPGDKSWDKNVELYGIFHDHLRGIKSWDFAGALFWWW